MKINQSNFTVRAAAHITGKALRGLRFRIGKSNVAWYAFDTETEEECKLQAGVLYPSNSPATLTLSTGTHLAENHAWDSFGEASVSIDQSEGVRIYIGTRILPLNPLWKGKVITLTGHVTILLEQEKDNFRTTVITLTLPDYILEKRQEDFR